jgi:hypothetical protein
LIVGTVTRCCPHGVCHSWRRCAIKVMTGESFFPIVVGGVDKHRLFCFCLMRGRCCLTSEAVKGAALPLQGVDYIEGSHSLPACVLGVRHCISDDVLKEHLQDASGLLVDES